MITIKRDRGWEKPESWQDVESIPGYVRDIDPLSIQLDAVVGKYREPELRICGFSNCHTKHFRGYLVTTKDGRITNIGVDCGRKHFGVDFENMSRQLDRDWLNQERRESIFSALGKLDAWKSACDDLMNGKRGASWLSKQHREMQDFKTGLPRSILRSIQEMMRTGRTVLYKERAATEQEKAFAKETGQRMPNIVQEEVGTLKGLSGLAKMEELLPKDLIPNLDAIAEIDVDAATEGDLQFWSKWCGEVDVKVEQAKSIIDSAQIFFHEDNISKLAEISSTKDEERSIMRFAKK